MRSFKKDDVQLRRNMRYFAPSMEGEILKAVLWKRNQDDKQAKEVFTFGATGRREEEGDFLVFWLIQGYFKGCLVQERLIKGVFHRGRNCLHAACVDKENATKKEEV